MLSSFLHLVNFSEVDCRFGILIVVIVVEIYVLAEFRRRSDRYVDRIMKVIVVLVE